MDWQPIESAPKDGTQVLIWSRGCYVARWDENAMDYQFQEGPAWQIFRPEDEFYSIATTEATHWMPLPSPPLSSSEPKANGSPDSLPSNME